MVLPRLLRPGTRAAFAAAAVCLGSLPSATAQSPTVPTAAVHPAPAELRQIRTRLIGRVRSREWPSFALGFLQGGEILWAEAIGWADREGKSPATAVTLYAVASVSKSLTATGAMALVGRGSLRLDTPADQVLARGRREGAAEGSVSLSHLLDHTSGVPHVWHYEYPDRPETMASRGRLIRDHAFIAVPPGRNFFYTNLGYAVVAELMERTMDAPFQRVMERVLFTPLAMRGTRLNAWVGDGSTARGYERGGRAIPYRFRLAPDGGAGFFSTLDDLLRYARFHLGAQAETAVPPESAISAALQGAPPGVHYVQGWGVVRFPGSTVLISDGQLAGGSAAVVLVPEHDLGVVVLCNATGCPAVETAMEILSVRVPGLADSLAAAIPRFERDLFPAGTTPVGRFEGALVERDRALPLSADFSVVGAPTLRTPEATYGLDNVRWSTGALEADLSPTTRPAGLRPAHETVLRLWPVGEELRGVLQEGIRDDRPGFARVSGVVLRPVR